MKFLKQYLIKNNLLAIYEAEVLNQHDGEYLYYLWNNDWKEYAMDCFGGFTTSKSLKGIFFWYPIYEDYQKEFKLNEMLNPLNISLCI